MSSTLLERGKEQSRRILIVDDNESIHKDFRKLLNNNQDNSLGELESRLFGTNNPTTGSGDHADEAYPVDFELDSAFQGKEGLEMIRSAKLNGNPYSVAFVDIRMPPGWDGVKTIQEIRKIDQDIQFVICTAYSDYSWLELSRILGHSSSLLVLKKPFDAVEVQQIALAMTEKWRLSEMAGIKMSEMEELVAIQTERLLKTSQQKDEFVSAFSHELRTPLSAINGHARLLTVRDSSGLSPSQLVSAREIEANGLILLGMVNDLLDLACFDAREENLVLSKISSLQLVESAIRMLSPQWRRKNQNIQVFNTLAPESFVGDSIKLKQVMINILYNAIKFSPDRSNISISTSRNEDTINISIADEGPGVDPSIMDRIFERYFQGENVKSEYLGGVGLGLTVARRLTELHDGNIVVENLKNKGACFSVLIPQQELVKQHDEAGHNDRSFDFTGETLAGLRVLVVDDNSVNRELISAMIADMGAEIFTATNGEDALEKALSIRPDVILMDLMMPVMGGIEATRRIKSNPEISKTPVIAVTASIDNTTLDNARKAGCFASVHKPVKDYEIREIILSSMRLAVDR